MNEGALASIDQDSILDEIANGAIMRDIAKRYGVKKQSLRERLIKHPRYQAAIAEQSESFVEDCVAEHREMSADMPVIARARARADLALKYAKAHNPAYADKQDAGGIQVNVVIAPNGVADAQQIEHVAVQITDKRA